MLAVKNQLLLSLLMLTAVASTSQPSGSPTYITKTTVINPLIEYSEKWGDAKYSNCNTASEITYLSKDEKEIIWILNLIRCNPKLASASILLNPSSPFYKNQSRRNTYFTSLVKTLNSITPNPNPLFADSSAYISAKCHAYSSGITGYVGHDRKNSDCEKDFYGECCDYGHDSPLNIVMSLLLDYNVPSLGHREICLSSGYTLLGVSIQPHKDYEYNAVLDFK